MEGKCRFVDWCCLLKQNIIIYPREYDNTPPQSMQVSITHLRIILNSVWPSDAIWQHISGSTLAQVMTCCLMAQAITWTSVDLPSAQASNIHMKAIS